MYAAKHGVNDIEARVRAAIAAGNAGEANRLRNEAMKLMQPEAETLWRSSLLSALPTAAPDGRHRVLALAGRRAHAARRDCGSGIKNRSGLGSGLFRTSVLAPGL
jgi:hypothetical protein